MLEMQLDAAKKLINELETQVSVGKFILRNIQWLIYFRNK